MSLAHRILKASWPWLALVSCAQARPQVQGRPQMQAAPVTVPPPPSSTVAAHLPAEAALPFKLTVRTRDRLPWGDGVAALGRAMGSEQNPEAPMSLDVDASGQIFLLDQVHARVLRLTEGQPPLALPVSRTAQELALAPGRLWWLDRLVTKQAVAIDPASGRVLATVPLGRTDIAEPGALTALQVIEGGLWAEVGHEHWQRLADAAGQLTPPARLEGRLTADGAMLLRALRVPTPPGGQRGRAVVTGRARNAAGDVAPMWMAEAQFDMPVHALEELAGDNSARVWLVADLVRTDAADRPIERKRMAVVWGSDGRELARAELCAPDGPEETLRSARLGQDGKLYNVCVQQQGVTVQEVAP